MIISSDERQWKELDGWRIEFFVEYLTRRERVVPRKQGYTYKIVDYMKLHGPVGTYNDKQWKHYLVGPNAYSKPTRNRLKT
jgi:hypothetical protein